MFPHKTLIEVYEAAIRNYPDQRLYTKNPEKHFVPVPFHEVYKRGRLLGLALADMGLEPRQPVAVFADNCIEWMYSDIAVHSNGAFNVPRGTDSMPAELEYILNHSEAKILFVENKKAYRKVKDILAKTKVEHVIMLDPDFDFSFAPDGAVLPIYDLIEKGRAKEKDIGLIDKRSRDIKPEDLFTLIYTSGTTGQPKGVMLCHRNMMYQLEVMPNMIGLSRGDRLLSVLPVWHIFERVLEYQLIHAGSNMYYSNPKDLKEDFIRVKPNFMGSAPRLWETIYYRLKDKVAESESINRWFFQTAYDIKKDLHRARNYLSGNYLQTKNESLLDKVRKTGESLLTIATHTLPDMYMDPIALRRVRAIVGGELRGTISGGGALPAHIDEFFNAIGIPVYEGYGMTETSPIISVRQKGKLIQGTVGHVTPGNDVKLLGENGKPVATGDLGVVHVKGPGVMLGYYKNPEATAKVLKDGWMNTGDLGFLDQNGILVLKGRAKDTIVLFSGENVEPVPIENELLDDPFIEQICVVGQDKKNLSALVWPDFDQLRDAGFDVHESDDLNSNADVHLLIRKIIRERVSAQNGFKEFEKVTDFRFLPKKFLTDDELTKLGKMKRNRIAAKYETLIHSMYA